jgi:transglutaminase-like putative cysteine protease
VTKIAVHSELRYAIHQPTSLNFAVLAAHSQHQTVLAEHLQLSDDVPMQRVRVDPAQHELIRLSLEPGSFTITYDATVRLDTHVAEETPAQEVRFSDVPVDVLGFLNPSRYCESDKLLRFAARNFGAIEPGFERVAGICNWIYDHLEYVPGSTDSSSTAVDVLVQGAGVCRDYAHLGMALCRAMGIPARYVSGYAVDLEPPDFHGFFEVYLDHRWFLFDATRMAPLDGLVRIASGRDAADAAFATLVGAATLEHKVVSAIDLDRSVAGDDGEPPVPAVTTA